MKELDLSPSKIVGGCLCGSIRYSSDADPILQAICHCTTCQRNTGTMASLNVGIPIDSLTVTGATLKTYIDRSGASGKPFKRHFCGACGSPIYSNGEAYGDLAFIKAGTLDDATWLMPQMHIWCSEKLPISQIPGDVTQVPFNPG
jgi:hypothetical protein